MRSPALGASAAKPAPLGASAPARHRLTAYTTPYTTEERYSPKKSGVVADEKQQGCDGDGGERAEGRMSATNSGAEAEAADTPGGDANLNRIRVKDGGGAAGQPGACAAEAHLDSEAKENSDAENGAP